MPTIDEIIHAIRSIMREQIPSTDKIEKIKNFVDSLDDEPGEGAKEK